MARGGKREGAGRPAGSLSQKTREVAERAAVEGITPLEFMLKVLRDDEESMDKRMWAAEKAAPYVHPKLSNVEVAGDPDAPIRHKIEFAIVDPKG
jgi:hypothetical protein